MTEVSEDQDLATAPGCAVVARLLGASPAGTATFMRSWLLIEQPGPWPDDALEQVLTEAFPPEQRAVLDELRGSHGLRPLLIRRPGRHVREPQMRHRTVYVGSGDPAHRWLEKFEVSELAELAALDLEAVVTGRGGLGEPVAGPMFLVCTHGTKDMCCAMLGRPLAAALDTNHPGRTWEVSHVGGDRWAGNLLVVPDGYLYGHLDADGAALVAKAALHGRVVPDHLRGRTSTPSQWAQHAEIAVRQQFGVCDLDGVLAIHEEPMFNVDPNTESSVVRIRHGRRLLDVTVQRRPMPRRGVSRCAGPLAPTEFTAEKIVPVRSG
jgi:hypothetical protein